MRSIGTAHAFADLASAAPVVAFAEPATAPSVRERTAQGFLLIRGVPLARTGVQIYGPNEVPLEPGPVGYIEVSRDEAELFSPATIASFEGVPVTNDHPRVNGALAMLEPANVMRFAVGVVLNVRRGGTFLIADVLIWSREMIDLVEAGKRQVSAGYNAVYQRVAAGRGRQVRIVGNHLAIVVSGRCGADCSFGDAALPRSSRFPPGFTPDASGFAAGRPLPL